MHFIVLTVPVIAAQALAAFVAMRLGGPCHDEATLAQQYAAATAPIKEQAKSLILAMGDLLNLRIGAGRHRALLFKALADAMGLPSSIAKGLAHVGSESGALVCVKVSGSPHHLDLVRAPGMLTPLRAGLPTIPPGGLRCCLFTVLCDVHIMQAGSVLSWCLPRGNAAVAASWQASCMYCPIYAERVAAVLHICRFICSS
jgi:uncharacterized membrane protein